ncbi:MAG: putative glycoside hydrolase [Candidatus Peribacteraceae bacterium]|nr:putative glycoside hydrolase [Candidatus Peribacteraceae bacterium]
MQVLSTVPLFAEAMPMRRSRARFFGAAGFVAVACTVFFYTAVVRFPHALSAFPRERHAAATSASGTVALPTSVLRKRERMQSSSSLPSSARPQRSRLQRSSSASGSLSSAARELSAAEKRALVRQGGGKGILSTFRRSEPLTEERTIRSDNALAVYLTPSSVKRADGFLERTMDRVVEAGGNALVFDVKGSAVYFDGDMPLAKELGLVQPAYDIADVIAKARERDIYTIGRLIAIKDYGLTSRVPDTIVKHPKTGAKIGAEWVDPSHPTALEYNRQVICALAQAGIDEVNLDYIRFSTAQFGALYAYSRDEKAQHIETFLKMAREAIDACGPSTKLGISSYAILGWNYDINVETLGQDVVRLAPLVDIISPMAYPATFTSPEYYIPGKNPGSRSYWLVYRTMTGYTDLLGPDHAHKLRPWIQGYYMDAGEIEDEIRAVYDAGYCGFQFWNANNNYDPAYGGLKLAAGVRPEKCR